MRFLMDFAPKMRPGIIKKPTFWRLRGRWFSRSFFGWYFGWFLQAKTFKNHRKNNGFEAFSTFRKSTKKYSKIDQKLARNHQNPWKTPSHNYVDFRQRFLEIFYRFWLLFDLQFRIIFETLPLQKMKVFLLGVPRVTFWRFWAILSAFWVICDDFWRIFGWLWMVLGCFFVTNFFGKLLSLRGVTRDKYRRNEAGQNRDP